MLKPGHSEPGTPEWFTLTTMESQLANEHAKHSQLDDRKSATRDQLDQKLKTVRTAITWLEKGVGPPSLPAGASPPHPGRSVTPISKRRQGGADPRVGNTE